MKILDVSAKVPARRLSSLVFFLDQKFPVVGSQTASCGAMANLDEVWETMDVDLLNAQVNSVDEVGTLEQICLTKVVETVNFHCKTAKDISQPLCKYMIC